MTTTTDTTTDPTLDALSTPELGGLLVTNRAAIDAAEARWLSMLAEFDNRDGWAADGHTSAVTWLVDKCGTSRPAAKDRLRVARELQHRPVLRDAFAAGHLSYSKVRALTRILNADTSADRTFLVAAEAGTTADMEQLARHYQLNQEQHTPPDDINDRYGVRIVSRYAGNATIETVVPVDQAERIIAILDTPVDSAESTGPTRSWGQRRVDTLLDLLEAGLAHLQNGNEVDAERATVNVVVDYDTLVERTTGGSAELDGGIPVSGDTARRLACDAGLVRIITHGASEILDVGRKTRHWNAAQRRAIRYRWAGHCAFPGCGRRITQIHHTHPWAADGETNLDAGVPLCHHHHTLVHEGGWTVTYDPTNQTATFTNPTGQTTAAPTPGSLKWAA